MVTAYDACFGALADVAGVDCILVGDSVGNVMLGMPNTLNVDLEDMIRHTRAVASSVESALVVADMPFGTFQAGSSLAVECAVELTKAGAGAVKLEGPYLEEISLIAKAGIPVIGHIGFTPQSVNVIGGFKVQGRGESASAFIDQAKEIESSGACAIVLELMPKALSQQISESLTIPTIGIGAGAGCDGQVQVLHDILGLSPKTYKHAKVYAELAEATKNALTSYADEVRNGSFPSDAESFD